MSMVSRWVKVTEQVLDTQTGRIGEKSRNAPIYAGDSGPHIWYWAEGNMECDCNRGPIVGIKDAPCNGDSRRFLLNLLDENGVLLYSEFTLPHERNDK